MQELEGRMWSFFEKVLQLELSEEEKYEEATQKCAGGKDSQGSAASTKALRSGVLEKHQGG